VLTRAISEAIARSDAKFAVADRFDETKNEYLGLILGRLVDVEWAAALRAARPVG